MLRISNVTITLLVPACAFLLAPAWLPTPVAAQSPSIAPAEATPNHDPVALLNQIKACAEQLDLTSSQKPQVETAFKNAADELQSAGEDLQNASPEDKTARFGQILRALRSQLGDLLTDNQKDDLQQKLQTLRAGPTTTPANTGTPTDQQPPIPLGTGQRPGGPGQNGAANGPRAGPGRGQQFIQRLKTALGQIGLSNDQQTQVDALFQDIRQQLQTVRAGVLNGSLDRDSAREKMQSIFQDSRTKLGSILTVEQSAKLRQLLPQNAGAPADSAPSQASAITPAPKPSTPPQQPAAASEQPSAPSHPPLSVGQQAPDFDLRTLDGEKVDLASYNHKLLVLVLGSYTNPSLRDRAPGLEALRDHYTGRGVNFLFVYTRETHPTGGWEIQRNKTDGIDISQPKTQTERNSIADRAKTALNLSLTTAPDTMDDKTATTYAVGDGVPAFLIDQNGKILFHQSWLEPMALEQAIQDAPK